MKNSSVGPPLGEAVMLMRNLFEHSAQIGMGILGALSEGSSKTLCDVVQGRSAIGGCDPCEIPAPCWEPQPLGEVTSFVAPGGKGTLRFRVTNCGFNQLLVMFGTMKPAPGLSFSPSNLNLGPLERGVVSATFVVSADVKKNFVEELVILIQGCRNYYLRWTVKVADCGVDMCNEIEVEDCPDNIHHWYDHFYCPRQCQDQRKPNTPGDTPNTPGVTPNTPGVTRNTPGGN